MSFFPKTDKSIKKWGIALSTMALFLVICISVGYAVFRDSIFLVLMVIVLFMVVLALSFLLFSFFKQQLQTKSDTFYLQEEIDDLKQSLQRTEEASKNKSIYLSNMSHEIRIPLSTVLGMLNMLKETSLDGDQRAQVEIADYSSEHLLQLVNMVLDNAKGIDKFNIDNGGSLFRLTSANLTTSYSFSSKKDDGKNKDDKSTQENLRNGGRDDDLFGRSDDYTSPRFDEDKEGEEDEKPSALYNYKVPWSLRVAYAVYYTNSQRQNEISSHSLMFSGDIELSPKWSVGASSGYDLKDLGFTYTQLRFERDLLSWRMNFSWVPFSTRSSWNFFIGIKSSILQDLKYEKRLQPDITL